MPRFAANLTMMFNEVPFPQRFAAAAQAGFQGVEFLFPYDYPPQEVAGWLRTPRVHMMAGLLPVGADVNLHRATYLANLRYAAQAVGEHGIDLLIEPINGRDMPGYFLVTQAQGHALRLESGAPNVKVQMDFYHTQIVEGDIAMTFRNNFDGIGHVQIASVPARNEPDDGEVNYPYLYALLDELGYAGWIGCEYRPRGRTEDGLGWLAAYNTKQGEWK